jgi:hypothetical protein
MKRFVVAALVLIPASAASAQLALSGYATASYSINRSHPASKLNRLRVFDFDDRKVKLDLVELSLQRTIAKPGQIGFRIDADAGQSMPRVTAARGLFRSLDGSAGNFDLRQIVVSYIAPVGSGLRIDAGKFVTHIGLDVIDGVDGANNNATRGYVFGFGEPYTHTGVKATYALTRTVTAIVQVSNGCDVVRDNNHARSFGAQLAFAPSDSFALSFNLMAGPERTGNTTDSRTLANVVSTWKASSVWSFGLDAVWGSEPNAAGPGVDGQWVGASLEVRRTLSSAFALSLRGEVFDDAHGDRTGTAQTLNAVTLTPEFNLTPHVMLRADLRFDHSSANVFENGTANQATQSTVLIAAVVRY